MRRDELGICLSHEMLVDNLDSTFTCIRAYKAVANDVDDLPPLLAFPQMKGKDVLLSMKGRHKLIWRADFFCPSFHK
ncbi:hypothetical protein [Vibrio rhizosphaerae]|uniref:Uncharacterized protein n=1 Tax=Vibrio rhizosphaerae TaxID=398736 RepID=A0ABU4IWL8_9VIBR|nr:hypothetical protein [Vibrio rhizosphaerae]MDW6093111.1 hypothetical protein [Vibrio rhizosphaerae]